MRSIFRCYQRWSPEVVEETRRENAKIAEAQCGEALEKIGEESVSSEEGQTLKTAPGTFQAEVFEPGC